MKSKIWLVIYPVFLCTTTFAGINADRWQQEVHYDIDVTLNDQQHLLNGHINLVYINHSPDTLEQIYLHLWPNGYANNQTAFAQQMRAMNELDFHFASIEDKGYIKGLEFTVNEQIAHFETTEDHIDIGILWLNKALLPGDTARVSTPFVVKIPSDFSRLGHVGQSYQISQWYPKPAVYDQSGWHPMPYLHLGEYYSEFGSFDVSITLPETYVVGATGSLSTNSETQWLFERSKSDSLEDPVETTNSKTIRYRAENVHDFAWFADKRYLVDHDSVIIDGKTIQCWTMYLPENRRVWAHSTDYLKKSVLAYSEWLGSYPYPQVTAVDGGLSAGAGMEYPMITVVSESADPRILEIIIAHEVGHNWLYGILGSNERDEAWLDEGINSYYEIRYMHHFYPDYGFLGDDVPAFISKLSDLGDADYGYSHDLLYLLNARRNLDQSLAISSADYFEDNYNAMNYGKGAIITRYLANYLGEERFDSIMQAYYQDWKFGHPSANDLEEVFRSRLKDVPLNWFFEDLVQSTKKLDYVLQNVIVRNDSIEVWIKNSGEISGPFPIQLISENQVIYEQWYDGFENQQIIQIPVFENVSKVVIDHHKVLPEINRKNNRYRMGKLIPRMEPLRLQWLGSFENPKKTQLFFAPTLTYNTSNRWMTGLALYNTVSPARKIEWVLHPTFSFRDNDVYGNASLRYYIDKDAAHHQMLALHYKRYGLGQFDKESLDYHRIMVEGRWKILPTSPYHLRHWELGFRFHQISREYPVFDADDVPIDRRIQTYDYWVGLAEIEHRVDRSLVEHEYQLQFQFSQKFSRIQLSAKHEFEISRNTTALLKWMGGYYMYNRTPVIEYGAFLPFYTRFNLSQNPGAGNTGNLFQQDYLFENTVLDRSASNDVLSRSIAGDDIGFRSYINIGGADEFLSIAQVELITPVRPLRLFTTAGYGNFLSFDPSDQSIDEISWALEAGVTIAIIPEVLEVHFPFARSQNIAYDQENILGMDRWYERITYTLNLNTINPFERLRQFRL